MRVLGMCGFYRYFVPNFAIIAEPLTRLLRKGVHYIWSDDKAFSHIKAVLACPPILAAPYFGRPFKLAVDACFNMTLALINRLPISLRN